MTAGLRRLGLTGSIGMGKTTAAKMFIEQAVPVHDADAAVHRLYAAGGEGADAVAHIAPAAVGSAGVNRAALKRLIADDETILARLEQAIHPLVAKDRAGFDARAQRNGRRVVVYDVPLLFETGGDSLVDAVIVVSAAAAVQRDRVLGRGTMTEEMFQDILARQTPDAEKRARADYVIASDRSFDHMRERIRDIIDQSRDAGYA